MHADAILLCSEAELILISAICSTSQTHFILHYKPLWKTVTLGKQHITQTNMRERQWVLYDLLFSPPTERRDGEKDTRGGKPHATHRCCLSQLPSMHHACRTYGVPLKLAPHGILSINVVSCWKKIPFFPHTSSKLLMSATLKLKDCRRHEYLNEAFHLKGAWQRTRCKH